jgi:hypothetical protein
MRDERPPAKTMPAAVTPRIVDFAAHDTKRERWGAVDDDAFNMSVRKYLKKLGVTAQREMELGLRERIDAGELKGDETLEAQATIRIQGLDHDIVVTGQINLA